jgi:hypothetical protein
VHFGDDQAYWVCKQTIANEVWPRGWMGTPLEALFKHTIGRTLQFKLGSVLSDSVSLLITAATLIKLVRVS